MRWERVNVNARARETPDGKKTPGRTGGIWGPGQRWGHTLNSVKNGRFIYVFGGFYGPEKCHSNDVFVFDTVKKTWSKPMVKGIPPSPRDSHSCTTVGNKLFVYGGTDGTNPLDDLHILDTSINTWIPSPADLQVSGPDAREGHSAALVGKRLFIFGGCGKSNNISGGQVHYNDLYILDTEKLKWECAMTTGHPPSPRDSHTCSSWKNRIIVLGGEDSSDCYLSDVHILDTDTLSWSQISTSGQMIAPRAGHTTVALGSNLFVFGGFTDDRNLYDDLHVLNLDTGIWSKVSSVNQGPSARFSVAGDCLDVTKGILVFMGGCNKFLEALDDMYYLYTALPELDVLPENRHEKFSMKKELKRKCQEESLQSDRFDKRNAAPCHGTLETSETLSLPCYSQEGTRYTSKQGTTFQARITNSGDYGYAIETVIGGKLLRGLILASTAGFTEGSRTDSARIEASVNKYQPTLHIIGENQQKAKSSDQEQSGNADGEDSTAHESHRGTPGLNFSPSAPDTNIDEPNKSSNAVEPLGSSIEHPMKNDALNNSDNQNAGNSCENSSSEVQPVPSLPTQGVDKEQDKTG
ncbi:Galactose oxidase/kelch beta-propeller-containing protein [Dioscorea alata]|uniref:Galactose oxidase/kelch beta-propeller-containing protein n=1 Tax=Dioscorea alata TaxID=55571 RepID=A0ACB7UWJ7_DIOAL|nr:Galactose oxidase/kelch beta-propeller-containing protein [Dioscorea alata]